MKLINISASELHWDKVRFSYHLLINVLRCKIFVIRKQGSSQDYILVCYFICTPMQSSALLWSPCNLLFKENHRLLVLVNRKSLCTKLKKRSPKRATERLSEANKALLWTRETTVFHNTRFVVVSTTKTWISFNLVFRLHVGPVNRCIQNILQSSSSLSLCQFKG